MMFKKISIIASMFFFLSVTNVFAHSYLETSSPKNGEVVTASLKEITLSFETKIESASTFTLKDANGSALSVTNISVAGNTLTGALEKELENGAYKIHWKIIGQDGHLLEGDIRFSVLLPANETTVSESASEQSAGSNASNADTTEGAAAKKTENAAAPVEPIQSEKPSFKNYVIPASVGILIIVGLGGYWLFYRRKYT